MKLYTKLNLFLSENKKINEGWFDGKPEIMLYDIHQHNFIKNGGFHFSNDLDLIKLEYVENISNHYNWIISFKGKDTLKNSGSIQAMKNNFIDYVMKYDSDNKSNRINLESLFWSRFK